MDDPVSWFVNGVTWERERPAQGETHGRSKNPAPRNLYGGCAYGIMEECVYVFVDVLTKGPPKATGY